MKVEQRRWESSSGWTILSDNSLSDANLVLVFGNRQLLEDYKDLIVDLKEVYPEAQILISSTSGEIIDVEVSDDSIVCTAVKFEKTKIEPIEYHISDTNESYQKGVDIGLDLLAKREDLKHVFLLTDGLIVNGSALVNGINEVLPSNISVTGGLAGDVKFEKTLVGINEAPTERKVIAIGFYGKSLLIGHGSKGGWDAFGPERTITKSIGNELFELDSQSALELYKKYLGDKAKDLPGSGLLFPLCIKEDGGDYVVRSLQAINEERQSLTFAGDVPNGGTAQLMKANFDKLIDAAYDAAERSEIVDSETELAILISCVGRKLILGQRIEEEIEEVREVFGSDTSITGFYSYGEISPINPLDITNFHNQTMTITTFSEEMV